MKVKNNILVSVITPCFNSEKYIEECIKSIQNQTYKNFEHILINDGSQDNTLEVIKNYSKLYKNIKVINNTKNKGISYSRNAGIAVAKGKYILWQDSDDIAKKTRIFDQLNFLEQNKNIAIVGSYLEYFGNIKGIRKYPLTHEEIVEKMFRITPIAQPASMVRKSVYSKVGLYKENLKTAEDTDMLFRISQEFKGANIPKVLLRYRHSPESITCKDANSTLISTFKIRKYYAKNGFKMTLWDSLFNWLQEVSLLLPLNWRIKVFDIIKNNI